MHIYLEHSLPMPTRDDIANSPVQEYAPHDGTTSGYTAHPADAANAARRASPIMEDPSADLERELAHVTRKH